jgi:hypothetical protein
MQRVSDNKSSVARILIKKFTQWVLNIYGALPSCVSAMSRDIKAIRGF